MCIPYISAGYLELFKYLTLLLGHRLSSGVVLTVDLLLYWTITIPYCLSQVSWVCCYALLKASFL